MTVTEHRRRTSRNLVNASDIALYLWKAHRVRVKPATIRQWASRGRISTYGIRRERYDLREAVAYAERVGAIPGRKEPDETPPDTGE